MNEYRNMITYIDLLSDGEAQLFNSWHYTSLVSENTRSIISASYRISLDQKTWCGDNTTGSWYWEQGPHWDAIYFREEADAIAFRLTFL